MKIIQLTLLFLTLCLSILQTQAMRFLNQSSTMASPISQKKSSTKTILGIGFAIAGISASAMAIRAQLKKRSPKVKHQAFQHYATQLESDIFKPEYPHTIAHENQYIKDLHQVLEKLKITGKKAGFNDNVLDPFYDYGEFFFRGHGYLHREGMAPEDPDSHFINSLADFEEDRNLKKTKERIDKNEDLDSLDEMEKRLIRSRHFCLHHLRLKESVSDKIASTPKLLLAYNRQSLMYGAAAATGMALGISLIFQAKKLNHL